MALEISQEYKDIAEGLIDKFPIALGHIDIDYILFLSEDEKTPKKYAEIRKIGSPYDFITEYKFIITVYEQVCANMNDAQKVMLIYHELLHIDNDFNKLKRHNLQDFKEICLVYGCAWDVDPNLPNILEDDDDPSQNNLSINAIDDDDEDEPEVLI